MLSSVVVTFFFFPCLQVYLLMFVFEAHYVAQVVLKHTVISNSC